MMNVYYVFTDEFYILLKNCLQKRSFANVRSLDIKKGELLQLTVTEQWSLHRPGHATPVLVDCKDNQVKCVPSTFVPFLAAIKDVQSRYNLFTDKLNLLTKNVLLSIGDKVEVRLEQETVPATGVIKYIGTLKNEPGTYFGIEIVVSI